MPPRPLMAGGCERAAAFPAWRRLCTCVTMDSRPVKNGLRRNGTFQTGRCTPPGEVAPAALDRLAGGMAVGLTGEAPAISSSIALLMPMLTTAIAASYVPPSLSY